MTRMMRSFFACCAVAAIFGSIPPVYSAENPPPSAPAAPADGQKKNREYFTDLRVTTHEGKTVKFYTDLLKDRVVLIHFFYTACTMHAPMQVKALTELQAKLGEQLGKEVFILSITVDPERDTPEKVREYAAKLSPRSGWTFVTGSKPNIDWINYRLGSFRENPADHPAVYLVGNVAESHWVKVMPEGTADLLAGHLRKLVGERKAEK